MNIFDSKQIIKWLSNSHKSYIDASHISVTGQAPISGKFFMQLLNESNISVKPICKNTDLLIVGEKDYDEAGICSLIKLREGRTLKIYTQEMFLFRLFIKDPIKEKSVAKSFGKGHPVLKYIIAQGVDWPNTSIPEQPNTSNKNSEDKAPERPKASPLNKMGYKVGVKGKSPRDRREILKKFLGSSLKAYSGEYEKDYLNQWGEAGSRKRLEKTVEHLDTFYYKNLNKKENGYNTEDAVKDYWNDLKWLREEYYDKDPKKFTFMWPEIKPYNFSSI